MSCARFVISEKRHFEQALAQFEHKDEVEIEWKSFLLNPEMKAQSGKSLNEYLSEIKGIPLSQAKELNAHVTKMAAASGLEYQLDIAVLANAKDAHRLIQLAKSKGRGDEAEEYLFHHYFTQGKDISDHQFLLKAGVEMGLDESDVSELLTSDQFALEVEKDIYEASQLGIRGVPFFVIDRKFGVSGAQPVEVFTDALQKAISAE
jgi:predicted DsbA family dithiol-disulfide isomerase